MGYFHVLVILDFVGFVGCLFRFSDGFCVWCILGASLVFWLRLGWVFACRFVVFVLDWLAYWFGGSVCLILVWKLL